MEPHASRETLVRRAQGGDRDAFEELFATYRERLAAVVRCRLGAGLRGRVEVEDVLQETFVRAFPAVARFEERHADSFFLWLSGFAVNVVRELVRVETRRAAAPLAVDVAGDALSPSHGQRRHECFERALDLLTPAHRQVIILARLEKIPISEIAARMERSPAAVSQLLMRALKNLKEVFGDTESLHLPARSLLEDAEGAHER